MKWISWGWWAYLFSPKTTTNGTPFLKIVWCRIHNHPNGQVFYNPGGDEPDYRCKDCREEI